MGSGNRECDRAADLVCLAHLPPRHCPPFTSPDLPPLCFSLLLYLFACLPCILLWLNVAGNLCRILMQCMKSSEEERHSKSRGKGQAAWSMTQSPVDIDSGHPSCCFPSFTLIPPLLFTSSVEFRPSYVSLSPIPALCVSLFFPLCFSPPLAFPASLILPLLSPSFLHLFTTLYISLSPSAFACFLFLPSLFPEVFQFRPMYPYPSPLSIFLTRGSLSTSPFPIPLSSVPTYVSSCLSLLSVFLFPLRPLLFSPVPFISISSSSFSFLLPFYC